MTTARKKWSCVSTAKDGKHYTDTTTPLGGKWKPASVPSDFLAMTNEVLPPVLLAGPAVSTVRGLTGCLGPRTAAWVTDCKGPDEPQEGLQPWTPPGEVSRALCLLWTGLQPQTRSTVLPGRVRIHPDQHVLPFWPQGHTDVLHTHCPLTPRACFAGERTVLQTAGWAFILVFDATQILST